MHTYTNPAGIFADGEDGEPGVLVELALMQMEASKTPVLVRRDRLENWWVVIQGPPGAIRCHVIDPVASALEGFRTPWHGAIALANEHAEPHRVIQAAARRAAKLPGAITVVGASEHLHSAALDEIVRRFLEGNPE